MTYYAGQKLGNHQLVRLLGRSSFTGVYLGKHVDFNTYAAIKVLRRQTSFKALNGFLEEARIIAELKHPHIVPILEFGIEKRCPFLVMQYVPEGNLRHLYARNVNSPAVILPYVKQIAAALHYAHEHKIIHQAVKPENMLLADTNNVLLSDFGSAIRIHNSYPDMSSVDDVDTMTYMAPEQLRGKPCAASDQYALAAVMYEWLCGCPPFDAPGMSIVKQHLQTLPVPLRRHVPALSDAVERVVLKALEKERQRRFASVQELALAFEEACGERLPDSVDVAAPGSSLQAPLLSASLHSNILLSEAITVADIATVSPPYRPSISRRMMITGLAGIGVTVCGGFLWRLSSDAKSAILPATPGSSAAGTLSPLYSDSTPVTRKSPTATASSATHRSSRKSSTSTTSSAANGSLQNSNIPSTTSSAANGSLQNSNTTSSAANGNGNTSAPRTPFPTPRVQPTSTPEIPATPTSTPTREATLTIQVDAKSIVINNEIAKIQVMTNMGDIPFRVIIEYFHPGKQNKRLASKLISGTTDAVGSASVTWIPSLLPAQIVAHTYARLQAVATGKQGNLVSSRAILVQVVEG